MVGTQGDIPSPKKSILNFHQERAPVLLYLLHVLLQADTQCMLLFLLVRTTCGWRTRSPSTAELTTARDPTPAWPGATEKRVSAYTHVTSPFLLTLSCSGCFAWSLYPPPPAERASERSVPT